jgi:excinuclease UvrABC helicase subunit UvrB
MSKQEKSRFMKEAKLQMEMYADMLEFEKAAELRDLLKSLE